MAATGINQYANTDINDFYLDRANLPMASDLLSGKTPSLIVVEPKFQYRMDLLSYELYGNSNYWWVIALLNRNQIKDPIRDLKAGMTLVVLDKKDLNGVV
jgi:hypothetical protein